MHTVQNLLGGERANLSRFVERIADSQGAHFLDELPNEIIVNLVRNKKALRCDARLPAIDCARFDRRAKSAFKIRARHHDECVAAAKLEDRLFDFARRGACNCTARPLTTRKRDRLHAWIDNYLFDLLGFDEQCLKNAFIESGAAKDLFNRERALRHVGGVLEQADIACHQRRRGESEHLPERKIPWHDGEDGSERFVMHVAARGGGLRGLVLQKSLSIFGVVTACTRTFFHFFDSRAEQLAHLERNRTRKFFFLVLE